MHSIHVRNVPDDLYESVKQSSADAKRSVSRHVQVLLRDALDRHETDRMKRRRILRDIEGFENALEPDFLKFL